MPTQNAYLSISDFPIVVLTECGTLSDLERTSVMEQLEDLIDSQERHVLIIDLSEGAELPEKQRIYVAEAIQMRSKAIAKKWAALAVVVSGPEHQRLQKAEFWLGIVPVPGRVFPSLELATEWAEQQIAPEAAATPQAAQATPVEPAGSADRASRVSRTGPVRIERPARVSKTGSLNVAAERAEATEKSAGKPAKGAKPKGSPVATRGRKIAMAAGFVALAALLLLLGPSGDGSLSSAEAREFERLKSGLGMRVYRSKDNTDALLAPGEKCSGGDKLGFEVDIPAKGYMMIIGAKADGSLFSVFPGRGRTRAGRIDQGTRQRLPLVHTVDETKGKQDLHLVYCPATFDLSSCTAQGKALSCDSDCATTDFSLDK